MTTASSAVLYFGAYRLDIAESRLTRDGLPVALRPKAFDLLAALARRPNELVTKDELLDTVWGRRFITEGVIKSIVGELRGALGDDPRQPRWIETVPRRGYRFVGTLHAGPGETAAPPASSFNPERPTTSMLGNVPDSLPDPIGRAEALASIAALHRRHRLVTICGPSGVGKTRMALALCAARRTAIRDGVWFVELASMAADATDVAMLCTSIAQALRLDATAGRSIQSLAIALNPLSLLLVLDNAEHVLHPLAEVVAGLLAATRSLHLVVTSQEPLRTSDEQVYRLAPLALPALGDDLDEDRLIASGAVQLFVQRVSARLQGFALAPQQQRAVAAICRALDGMPLALELAAARVPLLGVHGIADLLLGDEHDARLSLLTGGSRTAAPRQRTLRNAIDWSHGLLDETQQRVFRRLGVFNGGFSLVGAQSVCADDAVDAWQVLDALEALFDKSLIETVAVDGMPRFRMLESLRTFALERLVEAGEDAPIRDRHVASLIAFWAAADEGALDEPALAWSEQHGIEIDNLRTALRHADEQIDGDALVSLVAYSTLLWCRVGLAAEGRAWCDRARLRLAADDAGPMSARIDLAVAALSLYGHAYPPHEGILHAERAAVGLAAQGDFARTYFAIYAGFQSAVRGQVVFDRSAILERMAALEQPTWSDVLRRYLRGGRGYDRRLAGDAVAYLSYCRSELALCQALGAVSEGWIAAQGLMLAEQDMGHADTAIAIGQDAIDEIRARGRLRQKPIILALWTTMVAEQGQVERARRALAETLPILEGTDSRWMAHVALAWLATHEDRDEAAARVVGWHAASLASGRATGSGAYITRSLNTLTQRLKRRLGAAAFARSREAGNGLDDAAAEQLALG